MPIKATGPYKAKRPVNRDAPVKKPKAGPVTTANTAAVARMKNKMRKNMGTIRGTPLFGAKKGKSK